MPTKPTLIPEDRRTRRLVNLAVGLILYGVSVALMLSAGLGVDPWDVFHQGLAPLTGISFGWVINGVSIFVLILWIPLRQPPGIGTMANALVVGVVADATLAVLPQPQHLPEQVAVLSLGILANGVATGLYIGAGLGPGPRDGLMTGLAERTGKTIRSVRTSIELTVLAAGWLLGGPVGVGTALYAVSIGPLSRLFIAKLTLSPGTARNRRTTLPELDSELRPRQPIKELC